MKTDLPKYEFLWAYLNHWVKTTPDWVALYFAGQEWTYLELKLLVNNLVNALLKMGLQKGDRLVTILPSRPEYLITYLAASQLGVMVVPLDVRYKTADLRRCLGKIQPQLIVAIAQTKDYTVAEQLAQLKPELSPTIEYYFLGAVDWGKDFSILLKGKGVLSAQAYHRRMSLESSDGSLLIFTGGTTGEPKVAQLSHRNVVSMCYHEEAFLRTQLRRLHYQDRISSLAALPPSHVGGSVEFIFMGLLGGYQLYFLEHWSPTKVLEMTSQFQIPWMGAVPTMYHIVLALPELEQYDLSNLYLLLMSGERVTEQLILDLQKRICPHIANGYGSTEAGPELTFTLPGATAKALANGYVGQALPTVVFKIVDEEEKVLPPLQVGEILVKSDFTIATYFEMPEENRVGFDAEGYCRTGDLGYLDENGRLYLRGRKKHIIRVGSYTVMPTEVEEVALQLPEIALAAALGAPDALYGEVVWLFVVFHEGAALDGQILSDHLYAQLANYKVPKRIFIRPHLPTTRIGKADRLALRQTLSELSWSI